MAKVSGVLDKWREYFRSANSDIFDILENAIMVAAADCPKELKLRRDRIAEMLFTCKVKKCFGCDKVELQVPDAAAAAGDDDDEEEDEKCGGAQKCGGSKDSKESKTNSSKDDHHLNELNVNQVSKFSYGDAEALTDEIEQESQILEEVFRIKKIFENSEDESDTLIFESLRKLQLMFLSVEILQATDIGKTVNALRKHRVNNIRQLVRILIDEWKVMVEEYVNATAAFTATENTPESVNPVVEEEEGGLPSPPLDDLFFATETTGMELSQFFDGMDDDGNPRHSGEFNKNRKNGRKPSLANENIPVRKQSLTDEFTAAPKVRKVERPKKQEALMKKQTVVKPEKPSSGDSSTGRPLKPVTEQKLNNNDTKLQQKYNKSSIQNRPVPSQQNKLRLSEEDADKVKLEETKRKLQERYQEAENAKRQRTIQVMELRDIPKQGLGRKNAHMKPGNQNRNWANGRR